MNNKKKGNDISILEHFLRKSSNNQLFGTQGVYQKKILQKFRVLGEILH